MKAKKHTSKIFAYLIAIILLPSTITAYYPSPKSRINFMQQFFKSHQEEHKHCMKYNHSDFEYPVWKISRRNRYLNSSIINNYLLSQDKYFPVGNFKEGKVHSFLGKSFITFILTMILISTALISLVLPCPFWPKSWVRVLKNPFDQYKYVSNEDDSIKDKQVMVKLQKKLESMIFLKLATSLKKCCILFMLVFFAGTILLLYSYNFGEKSECGLVVSIYDMFEGKNPIF